MNTNISKAKKDKIALQNENHRMRIKYAKSKVGQMLQSSKSTPNLFNEVKESTKRYYFQISNFVEKTYLNKTLLLIIFLNLESYCFSEFINYGDDHISELVS